MKISSRLMKLSLRVMKTQLWRVVNLLGYKQKKRMYLGYILLRFP